MFLMDLIFLFITGITNTKAKKDIERSRKTVAFFNN